MVSSVDCFLFASSAAIICISKINNYIYIDTKATNFEFLIAIL